MTDDEFRRELGFGDMSFSEMLGAIQLPSGGGMRLDALCAIWMAKAF